MKQRQEFTICHITDSHQALDERIYFKAAKYACVAGYRVCICGLHPREEILDGIQILPVLSTGGKIKKMISSLTGLRTLVLKTEANIYQFHDPGLLLLGLSLALAGKCVIYDVHEDYEQKARGRLRVPFWLGWIIARCGWILENLISRTFAYLITADVQIRDKFGLRNATVIPNAPGEEFWRNAQRTRDNDNEFRLIYVGNLTRDRGIIQTLQALDFIEQRGVTFHVIGDTKDDELRQLLKSRCDVIWHGRLPWTELGNHLADADLGIVLLQPVSGYSSISGEGIVKLWEYLSLGLPVLISNFPRLEKLCHELDFGRTVDPTDARKIAGAIDYLIDHPEERKRYAENGKKIVYTEYNAENKMKALIKVYDNLLGIEVFPNVRTEPVSDLKSLW